MAPINVGGLSDGGGRRVEVANVPLKRIQLVVGSAGAMGVQSVLLEWGQVYWSLWH